MLDNWLPFLIYGPLALAIPASMMLFSFLFAQRARRRVRARSLPFESGVSQGPPRTERFTIAYYLVAMLFIVFDIEVVFLYSLGIQVQDFGWFAFWEFLFFIGILALAYVYVWRKGALNWQR
jgi:NADH-quinone oxidoreductase subunit A